MARAAATLNTAATPAAAGSTPRFQRRRNSLRPFRFGRNRPRPPEPKATGSSPVAPWWDIEHGAMGLLGRRCGAGSQRAPENVCRAELPGVFWWVGDCRYAARAAEAVHPRALDAAGGSLSYAQTGRDDQGVSGSAMGVGCHVSAVAKEAQESLDPHPGIRYVLV